MASNEMPCRITDEETYNPWENDVYENEEEPKTLSDLTLYDLMAEEHDMYLGNNKDFGFNIEISNEKGEIYEQRILHDDAVESLAAFCRKFLHDYEVIK